MHDYSAIVQCRGVPGGKLFLALSYEYCSDARRAASLVISVSEQSGVSNPVDSHIIDDVQTARG